MGDGRTGDDPDLDVVLRWPESDREPGPDDGAAGPDPTDEVELTWGARPPEGRPVPPTRGPTGRSAHTISVRLRRPAGAQDGPEDEVPSSDEPLEEDRPSGGPGSCR